MNGNQRKIMLKQNLILKIILTTIIIAPLGFVMGFPFPIGIRAIKKELIPWAWGVNGSASVLSPILAILFALFIGYKIKNKKASKSAGLEGFEPIKTQFQFFFWYFRSS